MNGLISIGMMAELQEGFDYHKHNLWQIVYYFQGSGTTTIGKENVHFTPGTIICFPPGVPHREFSTYGFRDYYFEIEAFNNQFSSIPCFQDNEALDFLNILTQMYKIYHLKQSNWKNISESLLSVLYQFMVSWSTEKRSIPLVELIKNALLSNLSNSNFCLEDIMKGFSLTPNHIRKVFKEETGMSPLQFLNEKRIAYAKDLLENRNNSYYKVKEIANLCGFEDPYYFSRLFKKLTSISPEGYKK